MSILSIICAVMWTLSFIFAIVTAIISPTAVGILLVVLDLIIVIMCWIMVYRAYKYTHRNNSNSNKDEFNGTNLKN